MLSSLDVLAIGADQRLGKERWYSHYALRVAEVERAGPADR
jgi:hypothetical protein